MLYPKIIIFLNNVVTQPEKHYLCHASLPVICMVYAEKIYIYQYNLVITDKHGLLFIVCLILLTIYFLEIINRTFIYIYCVVLYQNALNYPGRSNIVDPVYNR